jgi:hypothetical protein
MLKKSKPVTRFTRRDAGILAVTGLVVTILSVTCWHETADWYGRVQFRNYTGVVVSKVSILPGGKQMYPVRRSLVIEESDGKRETVDVTEGVYRAARPGMKLNRDRFGNASLEK